MTNKFNGVIDDIVLKLNPGYKIEDLSPENFRVLSAYVTSICDIETAFDILPCMMDESIIGGIQQEVAQRTYKHVYECMVCNAVNMIYSLLENQEDEDER